MGRVCLIGEILVEHSSSEEDPIGGDIDRIEGLNAGAGLLGVEG